jgi:hypothetical protein
MHDFLIFLSLKALKILRTAEFAPYVVFIAAPRIFEILQHHKTKDINVSAYRL